MPTNPIQLPQDEDNLIPDPQVPGAGNQPIPLDLSKGLPARPLDPYGIDVPAEIPLMRKAYAATHNGRGMQGLQEAGYSIVRPQGTNYHSATTSGPGMGLGIKLPPYGIATVHTHPIRSTPQPSPGDMKNSVKQGLPTYVYSEDTYGKPSLYVTSPHKEAFDQYKIADWNL